VCGREYLSDLIALRDHGRKQIEEYNTRGRERTRTQREVYTKHRVAERAEENNHNFD